LVVSTLAIGALGAAAVLGSMHLPKCTSLTLKKTFAKCCGRGNSVEEVEEVEETETKVDGDGDPILEQPEHIVHIDQISRTKRNKFIFGGNY
jgi:hypothetical protein